MSMMLKERKETIKEIIEADTDDMKEVLCLRATFAPTENYVVKFVPRRETMKEIIEADTDPKKEVLGLRLTFHTAPFDHFSTSTFYRSQQKPLLYLVKLSL